MEQDCVTSWPVNAGGKTGKGRFSNTGILLVHVTSLERIYFLLLEKMRDVDLGSTGFVSLI